MPPVVKTQDNRETCVEGKLEVGQVRTMGQRVDGEGDEDRPAQSIIRRDTVRHLVPSICLSSV